MTFRGSYPTGVAAANLTILSSQESANFGVTNNAVIAASDTSITVVASSWKSDNTLTPTTEAMRVAVLCGM